MCSDVSVVDAPAPVVVSAHGAQSDDLVISCRNVSKIYTIYDRPQDRLKQALLRWTGRKYYRDFWAVKDVSFDVRRGEAVAIIGRNGAGKSTLLQILAGTMMPTHGEVEVRGRVAAMLQLGSGFNPEFTGRENVFLNGAILGISRPEMENRFDSIVEFADIGEFLDQPVKTYSSGMHLRLAFAVAASIEPEVMIVDEALAVGDMLFQAKCTARLRRLMDGGMTLLLVTHGVDSVRSLCQRCIWMDHGTVHMAGDSKSVTQAYAAAMHVEHNAVTASLAAAAEPADAPVIERVTTQIGRPDDEAGPLRVRSVRIVNGAGASVDGVSLDEPYSVEIVLEATSAPISHVSVGMLIKDRHGLELTGESMFNTMRKGVSIAPGRPLTVRFSTRNNLRPDIYSIAIHVNRVTRWDRADNVLLYKDDAALAFRVLEDPDRPLWFRFQHPFEVRVS